MARLSDPDLTRRTAVCMMADSAGRVMAQEFFKSASVSVELEKLSEAEVYALARSYAEKVAAGIEPTALEKEAGLNLIRGLAGGATGLSKGLMRSVPKEQAFSAGTQLAGVGQRLKRGLTGARRGFKTTYERSARMSGAGGRATPTGMQSYSPAPAPPPKYVAPTAPSTTTGGRAASPARAPQQQQAANAAFKAEQQSGRPLTEAEAGLGARAQPAPAQVAAPQRTLDDIINANQQPAPAMASPKPTTGTGDVSYNPNARHAAPDLVPAPAAGANAPMPPTAPVAPGAPEGTRLGKLVEEAAGGRKLSVTDYLAGLSALGLAGGGGYMLLKNRGNRQAAPPQYGRTAGYY